MKALLLLIALFLPLSAAAADLDRYNWKIFADDMREMKADIKELNRRVAQIDKDALTKTEAQGLRESVNGLQRQLTRLEATTSQLPVTRISNLELRAGQIESDVDWMKGLLGSTATLTGLLAVTVIGAGVAYGLNRRKNGNGSGGPGWRGWPGSRNWYSEEGEK